jgi:hypothetical protein
MRYFRVLIDHTLLAIRRSDTFPLPLAAAGGFRASAGALQRFTGPRCILESRLPFAVGDRRVYRCALSGRRDDLQLAPDRLDPVEHAGKADPVRVSLG